MFKKLVIKLLKSIYPKMLLKARYIKKSVEKSFDPEMLYVDEILREKRTFIDIGCNQGYLFIPLLEEF